MYMCALVIDFDCFYDFSIIFWNCSGSVAFFVFKFFVFEPVTSSFRYQIFELLFFAYKRITMINCIYNYHGIIYSVCKSNQSLYTEEHGKDMSPEGHMYSECLHLFGMFMQDVPTKPAVSLYVLICFYGCLIWSRNCLPFVSTCVHHGCLGDEARAGRLFTFLSFVMFVFVLCLVLSVDSVSVLFILDCSFGFLSRLY